MYFISFIWLIFFSSILYSTIRFNRTLFNCNTIVYNFSYSYL
nr:MAG TPA: hypothetical protein [Bacteriophage sp.]